MKLVGIFVVVALLVILLEGDSAVVIDNFVDDEAQKFLGEFDVEAGVGREVLESLHLALLAGRVRRLQA